MKAGKGGRGVFSGNEELYSRPRDGEKKEKKKRERERICRYGNDVTCICMCMYICVSRDYNIRNERESEDVI